MLLPKAQSLTEKKRALTERFCIGITQPLIKIEKLIQIYALAFVQIRDLERWEVC